MHEALNRNLYLVREHVGMFKAANNFDILDPQTGESVLECREDNLGGLTKVMRFTKYKRMTPFHIELRPPGQPPVVTVKRGTTLLRSNVDVLAEDGIRIGGFKQKLFSLGGKFDVLDPNDAPVCTLKGKWTGWEFRFERDGQQLAQVSKQWAGLGKELFTSADNYVVAIDESVPRDDPSRPLILAAVMCIDMVLKE